MWIMRDSVQSLSVHGRPGRTRVLIAGGGVAALEAMLALHDLAGHRVHLMLLAPETTFVYRPVSVGEAFGRSEARSYPLEGLVEDCPGTELIPDSLAAVRADRRVAVTGRGSEIPYDRLVVALGAKPVNMLPGALAFRGRPDVQALRAVLADLVSGAAHSVALTLPSERVWSLPLYELGLMVAEHLREQGVEREVVVVTPEEEPLGLFGPVASQAIERMLTERGVRLRTSSRPAAVRGRALVLAGGAEIYADRVIAMPALEGPRLSGLPHDSGGFIPVDSHGRVSGLPDVFAAGDVTSFPLKQGGLAAQQADAVAEAVAAELGVPGEAHPFKPVLRGLLMTPGAPLYLRAEPQHLPRSSSVAIEAGGRWPRHASARVSVASDQPLWWPPVKIAGRYLGPALATARASTLISEELYDRVPVEGPANPADEQEALELALLLADCDARWGDYAGALSALRAAEALQGFLPPEYEAKRREWAATS